MLLAAYLDASQCWYAEVSADCATFHTRGGWFPPDMPPIPASGRIADFGPELVTTMSVGQDFVADDPAAMMRVANEELARILDVPRVGYVSMDEAVEYGVVGHNDNDVSRVPDLPARRERLDDYGLDLAADLRAGRVMKVSDLATDPRTAGPPAQAHAEIGARASIAAPIQVGGKTGARTNFWRCWRTNCVIRWRRSARRRSCCAWDAWTPNGSDSPAP